MADAKVQAMAAAPGIGRLRWQIFLRARGGAASMGVSGGPFGRGAGAEALARINGRPLAGVIAVEKEILGRDPLDGQGQPPEPR